jgi:hypothetical protein
MSVSRTLSINERAEQLLRQAAADPDGSASRINLINGHVPAANANLPERRLWAEAWLLLQRAGFVCREPNPPSQGDWWFVTGVGRAALGADFEGALGLALGRL